MRVRGFGRISLALGSSDAVTVTVRGKKELAMLAALRRLSVAPRGTCMDTSTAFSISVTVARSHQPFVVMEDP